MRNTMLLVLVVIVLVSGCRTTAEPAPRRVERDVEIGIDLDPRDMKPTKISVRATSKF
jgi:hypothetical protein